MSQPDRGPAHRGISGVSRVEEPAGRGRHISNVTAARGSPVEGPPHSDGRLTIFAAMPFDPAFDDVYFVGIVAAAKALGGTAIRVDQVMHGADAVAETQRQIRRCDAVIADLSTSEPDVLYELGFAEAIGKPSVQICSTPYDELPFMVRNRDTLLYRPGRTHLLGQQLATYLSQLLAAD